ncbi:hypothetical protein KW796_02205 [Candidatus Parcubacteria bacterium]|nr:hypothetical protein [Candidatus Parcubacteria bacterium]
MAMAIKPQALHVPILSDIPAELLRLAAQYRFNPANGAEKNRADREEFGLRVGSFISENLEYGPGKQVSPGNVTIALTIHREPLIRRESQVSLSRVNQLTLVWALRIITMGYRGFMKEGVLEKFKRENVVWLVRGYNYALPPDHALFCPFINKWEEQGLLWRLVRDNDMNAAGDWPVTPMQIVPANQCGKCAAEYKAAR